MFLLPLKIFEIPIVESEINKHRDKLFGSTYKDNKFNITFNLKEYIDVLQTSQNKEHKEYVFGNIHNIKGMHDIKGGYIEKRKELIEIEELTVLSSLKFKDIEEIKKYFEKYFTVKTKICEKGGNKFVSIFLTPKNDSDNAKTDNI